LTEEKQNYVRNSDFIFRRIVDEIVLIPIHKNVSDMNSIYSLNEIGALIWEHLEQPANLEDLCSIVMNEYEVDQQQALGDIKIYLSELSEFGAVKKV